MSWRRNPIVTANEVWSARIASTRNLLGDFVIALLCVCAAGFIAIGTRVDDGAGFIYFLGLATLAGAAVWWRITASRIAVFDFAAGHVSVQGERFNLTDARQLRLSWWCRPPNAHDAARRTSGWRIELFVGEHTPCVLDTSDELAAWRAAEALARKLQVPLLDDTGDEPRLRETDALDESLAAWATRHASAAAPGDAPPKLSLHEANGTWCVTRQGLPWSLLGVALAVVAALAVLVVTKSAYRQPLELVLPLIGTGALVLLIWAALHGSFGRLKIELATDTLTVRGPFPRGARHMSLAGLEHVRLLPHATHFVSDAEILRIPLRGEQGRWFRRALVHRLHLLGATTTPYR